MRTFTYEGWQTSYFGYVIWNKITKTPWNSKENSRDMKFTNCSPYILSLNVLEVKFSVFNHCVKQLLLANNLFIVTEFIFVTDFLRYRCCEFIYNVFRLILWFQQSLIFLYGKVFKVSSYCYTFSNSRFEREYCLLQSVQLGDRLQSSSENEIYL